MSALTGQIVVTFDRIIGAAPPPRDECGRLIIPHGDHIERMILQTNIADTEQAIRALEARANQLRAKNIARRYRLDIIEYKHATKARIARERRREREAVENLRALFRGAK